MKILITGGSGLLGKSLSETAPKEHEVISTYNKNWQKPTRYRMDIRQRSEVFEVFELVRPNVVIHCASIGSVDYTERHYQEVRHVNVGGLNNIIDAANGYKSKVVYISTNAVYSGKCPPYNEASPLEPVNSYGVIKREAEMLVKAIAHKWLIFRPFMLYGWPYPGGRQNWVTTIIDRLSKGQPLELVNDTYWMPTYAPDCAGAIWKLLTYFDKEIFNVAAPDRVTLYEFGLAVCDVFGLDKGLISPTETKTSWEIAERPKNTTYDLVKLTEVGVKLSGVKEGLKKMRDSGG